MKKKIIFLKNISIVWKFFFIYLIIIMLPLLIIWVTYYRSYINTLNLQSDSYMRQNINQIKQNANFYVRSTENLAKDLMMNEDLPTFLNGQFTFTDDEAKKFSTRITSKFFDVKSLYNSTYSKIRIFSSNKSLGENYDYLYFLDKIENTSYFKSLSEKTQTSIWGAVKTPEEFLDGSHRNNYSKTNSLVVPYYTGIYAPITNDFIGVLEIDFLENKILYNLDDVGNMGGNYVIIDSKNTILNTNLSERIKNVAKQIEFDDNKIFTEKIDGTLYRIDCENIPNLNYKIIAFTTENSLYDNKWSNFFYIYIVLGAIIIVLCIFLTPKILLKRLNSLLKMTKKIEDGDFSVRSKENSSDEIGKLAKGFDNMTEKLEETIFDLIEKKTSQQDAEIKALQSQINPHFLYNTLECLRMECEIKNEVDIANALASLGRLFRYNIHWNSSFITLKDEINHVRNYISIMEIRFKNKIKFEINVEEKYLNVQIIKTLLQPLVENCFTHAFKDESKYWEVGIKVCESGEFLTIIVFDNGVGFSKTKLENFNNMLATMGEPSLHDNSFGSVGLWNVNARLKIFFGNNYGLRIKSDSNVGTEILVRLPALNKSSDK